MAIGFSWANPQILTQITTPFTSAAQWTPMIIKPYADFENVLYNQRLFPII